MALFPGIAAKSEEFMRLQGHRVLSCQAVLALMFSWEPELAVSCLILPQQNKLNSYLYLLEFVLIFIS